MCIRDVITLKHRFCSYTPFVSRMRKCLTPLSGGLCVNERECVLGVSYISDAESRTEHTHSQRSLINKPPPWKGVNGGSHFLMSETQQMGIAAVPLLSDVLFIPAAVAGAAVGTRERLRCLYSDGRAVILFDRVDKARVKAYRTIFSNKRSKFCGTCVNMLMHVRLPVYVVFVLKHV